MGKLVGLLSSGVGLAAEALSQGRSPSADGRTMKTTPDTSSSYGNKSIRLPPSDAPPPYNYSAPSSQPRSRPLDRQGVASQYDAGVQGFAPQEKVDSYTKSRNLDEREVAWSQGGQQLDQCAYSGLTTAYDNGNRRTPPYPLLQPEGLTPSGPLPLPVIIPQRRPENKSRGWMLAYAPMLNDCGIDQATFVDFLRSFNEASKSSPYLDVVNVAAQGVGFAPGITPIIISMAVPVAVKYAKTAQTDRQTDNFLGRMNSELFEPRGMFAMVMTFKPEEHSKSVSVDTSSSSAAVVQGLRANRPGDASDTTYGELQLPASALLVFVDLDDQSARPQDNKFKESGHFVADYFDRRAQAQYSQKNPDSALSGPAPRFNTRFGDPNHAANSGSLVSLVSGGLIQRPSKDQNDRKSRHRRKTESGNSDSSDNKDRGRRGKKDRRPGLIGGAKGAILGPRDQDQGLIKGMKGKIMKTDVLYLMIANKPTDSQMATPDITLSDVGYAADVQGTRAPFDNQVDAPAQYGIYSNQRTGYIMQQGRYSDYDEGYFPHQDPAGAL